MAIERTMDEGNRTRHIITTECALCGMPREEFHRDNLAGHLIEQCPAANGNDANT